MGFADEWLSQGAELQNSFSISSIPGQVASIENIENGIGEAEHETPTPLTSIENIENGIGLPESEAEGAGQDAKQPLGGFYQFAGEGLCFMCGGSDFWPNLGGDPVCWRCHPPAPPMVESLKARGVFRPGAFEAAP